MSKLRAPFPYAGGKAKVTPIIWSQLGAVEHYREPFCGSAITLLAAPSIASTEIINDASGHITNVWRSIKYAPQEFARVADWPINEIDLFARHVALVHAEPALTERLQADPLYYDCMLAPWWVWGASQWIGSEWCTGRGAWSVEQGRVVRVRRAGVGAQIPTLRANGSNSGFGSIGIHSGVTRQLPMIAAYEPGAPSSIRSGVNRVSINLLDWIAQLSERLRNVRVVCGTWDRILTDSTCWNYKGVKAIMLDPPYPNTSETFYKDGNTAVWFDAQRWAIEHGSRADARIVLCGMDDQQMPSDWRVYRWKRKGGYGNQSAVNVNAAREVLWFSPHCAAQRDSDIFTHNA